MVLAFQPLTPTITGDKAAAKRRFFTGAWPGYVILVDNEQLGSLLRR
jgi:hypothetical protein